MVSCSSASAATENPTEPTMPRFAGPSRGTRNPAATRMPIRSSRIEETCGPAESRAAAPGSVVVVRRARPVPLVVVQVVVDADLRERESKEVEHREQSRAPPCVVADAEGLQVLGEVQTDLEADLLVTRRQRRNVAEALREEGERRQEKTGEARISVQACDQAAELQVRDVDLVGVAHAEEFLARSDGRFRDFGLRRPDPQSD